MLLVKSALYRGTTVSPFAAMLMYALILQHCAILLAAAVAEKRAGVSGSSGVVGPGQPEEIFTLDNRLESNYDEYPMVVPKRAALLLDRLMVALHHALEQERRKIGEFYDEAAKLNNGNKHAYNQQRLKDKNNSNNKNNKHDYDNVADESGGVSFGGGEGYGGVGGSGGFGGGGTGNLMYSDDDPNVLLDYDFKDLNSINRATGQTLANNFQRRGHGGAALLEPGDGLALLHSPIAGGPAADVRAADTGYFAAAITKLHDDATAGMTGNGGLDTSGGGGGRNNVGRMYWRCYFNAVSCF